MQRYPGMQPADCQRGSPAAQAVQVRSSTLLGASRVVPGMQVVQAEAPDAFFVSRPLGHGVHWLAANWEGRKVRRGQASHRVAPVAVVPVPPLAVAVMPVT